MLFSFSFRRLSSGLDFQRRFGHGLDIHVLEAYHFFVNNYEKGDKLFLFGFSRGAFTARAIASLISMYLFIATFKSSAHISH